MIVSVPHCNGCVKVFYTQVKQSSVQSLSPHMHDLPFWQALLLTLAKYKGLISCETWHRPLPWVPGDAVLPFLLIITFQVPSAQTDAILSLPLLELAGRLQEGSLSPKTVLYTYIEKVSAVCSIKGCSACFGVWAGD